MRNYVVLGADYLCLMCFYLEGLLSYLNFVISRYKVFLGKLILGRSADAIPTFMESTT